MNARLRSLCGAAWLVLAGACAAAPADATLAALEYAAARGDPVAQTGLAVLYEHAEGLAKDLKRATALYCQAARQGYAAAQFNLGWIYANGRGLPRDDGIAAALFQNAAAQGHPGAAKLLVHIRPQPDAQMPSCLAPDPVVAAESVAEVEQVAAAEPVAGAGPMAAAGPVTAAEPATRIAREEWVEQRQLPAEPARAFAARQARTSIKRLVYAIAPRYAVDPELALAMIAVESDFNPSAVSPKHAQGLMQLIPETALRFGVKRVLDPVDNINGGLAYIRWLLAFFQGNVQLVIAAYNAGEGAVEKHRGIPPYAETRRYVQRITGMYTKAKHPFEEHVAPPSALVSRARRGGG